MTTAGSFDAPIEIFSGLVTDMAPADLPHGVSPDCQDVVFSSGGVATRPGLQTLFGALAGKSHHQLFENLRDAERHSARTRARCQWQSVQGNYARHARHRSFRPRSEEHT